MRPHINIPVKDIEASVEFYSKVFSTPPSKRKPGYANFRLDKPSLHLALMETPGFMRNPGNDHGQHFGVELFEDSLLASWKDRVKMSGLLPHLEEENVTCCYAVADKFWLKDPDGNEWEFWVRHDDEGETLFSSTEASACCAPTAPKETNTCVPASGGCC